MVLGEWVDRPDGDALFADVFSPEEHVIEPKGKKQVCPLPGFPVVVGYDLGQTSNAVTFSQPILTKKNGLVWLIFDELVSTNKKVPYDVLVRALLRKMQMWERICRTSLRWYHVSDDSAFNQYRPGEGSYDHLQIQKFSKDFYGEYGLEDYIKMVLRRSSTVPRRPVSVSPGNSWEGRLRISKKCEKHVDMFMSLQMRSKRTVTTPLPYEAETVGPLATV